MRVVYFGTAAFAVPALERIAKHVVAVVSQPARPTGRGLGLQPSPVTQVAERLKIPLFTPEQARGIEFVDELKAFEADLFVVAAYGQILRKSVLDIPKHGCVNLHGSLLPKYRGAAPIQRCIEAGDTETGVTLMLMDRGMDTGPMIAKTAVAIDDHETYGELSVRLAAIAADILDEYLPSLAQGAINAMEQDEEQASYAPKITKDDSTISFEMDATKAYNRFRAVYPSPGAVLETSLGPIKIHQARLMHDKQSPGDVIRVKPTLVVSFNFGSLELREVQMQGRRRMSGAEFANGARILPGTCLLSLASPDQEPTRYEP